MIALATTTLATTMWMIDCIRGNTTICCIDVLFTPWPTKRPTRFPENNHQHPPKMLPLLYFLLSASISLVIAFNEAIWELDTQSRRFAYEAAGKFEHPRTRFRVYFDERRASLQSEIPDVAVIPARSFPTVLRGLNISVPEGYKIIAPSKPLLVSADARLHESCVVPFFSYVSYGSTQGYRRAGSNLMELTGLEVVVLKQFPLGIKTALARHAVPTEKSILFMNNFIRPQTDTISELIDVALESVNNSPPLTAKQPFMASVPLPTDLNFHPKFLENSGFYPARIYKLMTLAVLNTYSNSLHGSGKTLAGLNYFLPGAEVVAYSAPKEWQLSMPLVPEFHPFDAFEPVCTTKAHGKHVDQPYKLPRPGFIIKWYAPESSKDLLVLVLYFDKHKRPASPENLDLLQTVIKANLLVDRWSVDSPEPIAFELLLAVARASI